MSATKERPFVMTAEQVESDRAEFTQDVRSRDGGIFNNPQGAGYWAFGVEYDQDHGWLLYEFDEREDDCANMDFSEIVAKWRAGEPLPERYFRLNYDTARKMYNLGRDRWGCYWRDEHDDLNSRDLLLQMALFGEERYA
jgi:hypothetical protein